MRAASEDTMVKRGRRDNGGGQHVARALLGQRRERWQRAAPRLLRDRLGIRGLVRLCQLCQPGNARRDAACSTRLAGHCAYTFCTIEGGCRAPSLTLQEGMQRPDSPEAAACALVLLWPKCMRDSPLQVKRQAGTLTRETPRLGRQHTAPGWGWSGRQRRVRVGLGNIAGAG